MDSYELMEAKLQKLVPASLSDVAQCELETQIDELTGVNHFGSIDKREYLKQWGAVAALLTVLVALSSAAFLVDGYEPNGQVVNDSAFEKNAAFTVLNAVNRMEAVKEDGVIYPDDGGVPYFRYRYEVSNDYRVLDEQTGTVITVRQPSYEVVTIPQKVF